MVLHDGDATCGAARAKKRIARPRRIHDPALLCSRIKQDKLVVRITRHGEPQRRYARGDRALVERCVSRGRWRPRFTRWRANNLRVNHLSIYLSIYLSASEGSRRSNQES